MSRVRSLLDRPPRRSTHRAAALALLAAPLFPLVAQRQPVLKQIKVPHSYYFREMYLPQVTSGPSSVTWAPDGRALVYSMQGSLWRQRVGNEAAVSPESLGVAVQLTDGPGYDYQPDWSPDGRSLVYASYVNDAIALRLLDLSTLESRTLVSNGAVNVEPRWSPDGSRIAFVSTAFEGRWHIFIQPMRGDSSALPPFRLTVDTNSGLPRYYYSEWDHYLSPTWSPDGKELILVSNRGHIWGSGGFWRIEARPGAEPREIHYEETTWKARPDWAPDGKRVVYSSYLGRQWNQLWLMTGEGGDPLQLTYGDFDATAPRWSPDGRHIAYVSNQGGNPSLWTVEIPGGRRLPVEIRRREYRGAMGRLRITVIDRTTGKPVPARVSVTGGDGRGYAPDDAWRHADDGFDRSERPFEYTYFHSAGSSTLTVPPGRLTVEVIRGLEYRVASRRVEIAPHSTQSLRVVLDRLDDLPARGWYSGDLHVHMNYGGAYRNDPGHLAFQARAEDLHLVENLIVNKEGRVPDLGYFTGKPDPASSPGTLILHDEEFHTSFWGHTGLLGLRSHVLLPGYAGYVNTPAASLYPTNAAVLDLAHRQGALTGYVHPFDSYPDPANADQPLTDELPVDVALGKVDYYEALGFVDDYLATQRVWYQLLNCGFRLPAGAGTDAMANFASLRGPVGMNRVFVRTEGTLTQRNFLAGLKAGRSFATNGPLLGFTMSGHEIGDAIRLPAGRHTLTVSATLRSIVPVDHFELVANDAVVATLPLSPDRTSGTASLRVPVERSGWYLVRAWSDHATHPVLDLQPIATTSPIYVTVGGEPVRSPADADYFLRWIDRLDDAARAHPGWNDVAERDEVLRTLDQARLEFRRRGAAGGANTGDTP